MRRIVALALVQALVASTAIASSLHVHEYVGHDHPDHHHGPASHEHRQSAQDDHDHHSEETEARGAEDDHFAAPDEACDPGRHAVSITLGCAQVPQVNIDVADVPGPSLFAPRAPIRSVAPVIDVRVHGPPLDIRIPARAPPVSPLA